MGLWNIFYPSVETLAAINIDNQKLWEKKTKTVMRFLQDTDDTLQAALKFKNHMLWQCNGVINETVSVIYKKYAQTYCLFIAAFTAHTHIHMICVQGRTQLFLTSEPGSILYV